MHDGPIHLNICGWTLPESVSCRWYILHIPVRKAKNDQPIIVACQHLYFSCPRTLLIRVQTLSLHSLTSASSSENSTAFHFVIGLPGHFAADNRRQLTKICRLRVHWLLMLFDAENARNAQGKAGEIVVFLVKSEHIYLAIQLHMDGWCRCY